MRVEWHPSVLPTGQRLCLLHRAEDAEEQTNVEDEKDHLTSSPKSLGCLKS